MKLFEVEQYELHATKYRVQANTEAEAIASVLAGDGKAEMVDDSTEYVEVAENYGAISRDDDPQLFRELAALDAVRGSNEFVPSIRSVTEVTDDKPE